MLGLIFTATVLGVVAGLFGIFLRTCMLEDMIFYPWYKLLSKWVGAGDYAGIVLDEVKGLKGTDSVYMDDCGKTWKYPMPGSEKEALYVALLLKWLAFPLGYCVYCTTTWIALLMAFLWFNSYEIPPVWEDITICIITILAIQHFMVAWCRKSLIKWHPDLEDE